MTLFHEMREQVQKMKRYKQEFVRGYDASRHRVDATRKDIEKWTIPQVNRPTRPKN